MLVYVFPGQGSEKKGMGAELFDQIEEFTSIESQVDELLGYSLRELCLEDPQGHINLTQFTQPALFVTNALHFYQRRNSGQLADIYAGHSLGEYNALLAAGAFDLLTGVKLVQKRGALMSQARDGGMAAVVGLDVDTIRKIVSDNGLDSLDLANFNSPLQTVVSGPVDAVRQAKTLFDGAGARLCVVLPASAAFHSRYMVSAAKEFGEFLKNVSFNPLQKLVVANVTAQPYNDAGDGEVIRSLLTQQIHSSVRWTDSIRYIKSHYADATFEEVGPGKVLARLIQQIN